jgi:ABC-type phosphate/phosphonate transport system permease subunit
MVNKRAQFMANKRKRNARKKTWKELSPMAKVGTITGAIVQLSLLFAAQRDISHRPAAQIRGSKMFWRLATLVNFVGPGSYFTFGVKRSAAAK